MNRAIAAATAEIERNRAKVSEQLGKDTAAIFSAHIQMLNDRGLRAKLEEMIRQRHYSPEYSVSRALRQYAKVFQSLEGDYMPERANDIFDIEKRLLRHLFGTAARRAGAHQFRSAGAGAQSHAQRNGEPQSEVRDVVS